MSWDYIDEKKFRSLVKQISGTITEKDGELVPYHSIKGVGEIWCYQPSNRVVARVIRGTKIYVLDMGTADDIQCLALSNEGVIFTIDKDEIEELGFN